LSKDFVQLQTVLRLLFPVPRRRVLEVTRQLYRRQHDQENGNNNNNNNTYLIIVGVG
jgi:hypothetical protein